jgi:hypothetical protein
MFYQNGSVLRQELYLKPKLKKNYSTDEGRYTVESNKPWKVTVEKGVSEKMHFNLTVGLNLFV